MKKHLKIKSLIKNLLLFSQNSEMEMHLKVKTFSVAGIMAAQVLQAKQILQAAAFDKILLL